MSLCVSFYLDGSIYAYADTRVSACKNGVSYHVHDEYNKLRQVGNKVIFTSGELEICDSLFAAIDERSTVADIADAARKSYTEFKSANPHYDGGKFGIEFGAYVHVIEDGTPAYYQLRYIDDFKIDRQVPNNQEIFAVAGRSQEALASIDKLLQRGIPVDRAILRAYERLTNETIGGNLVRYTVTPSDIKSHIRPIRESRPLRKWPANGAGLHADMQGNVIARKITLTGQIENSSMQSSNITGGTITGALIRTAASGARVEMDSRGWRTYDQNNRERISINSNDTYGMSAISFAKSSGGSSGYINGGDSIFQITSLSDMMFAAVNGWIYFQGNLDFSRANNISGLSASKIEGLSGLLSNKVSRGESTSSSTGGSHNHGFPNGTQFKDVNGQVHTWSSYSGFSHQHTV
ncbi:hypothetical protein [Paenibacillus bouchesdurhonensis]|uniref:hypothetical protein n=1 Tax=Paenibacillus bouchesdurhonensis TaxID=1870990 RepID=UPI000DA6062F|nr:hypothetical protein [Paenibacillus bouchesdurhonensis]